MSYGHNEWDNRDDELLAMVFDQRSALFIYDLFRKVMLNDRAALMASRQSRTDIFRTSPACLALPRFPYLACERGRPPRFSKLMAVEASGKPVDCSRRNLTISSAFFLNHRTTFVPVMRRRSSIFRKVGDFQLHKSASQKMFAVSKRYLHQRIHS